MLVLQYGPKLLTTCRRYAPTSSSAEDILQEAFIKVYLNINNFNPEKGNLLMYMNRICINTALDKQLKMTKSKIDYSSETTEYSFTSEELSAIEKLQAEEILNLLKELPQLYSLVFNLYVIEGYSHKEIGKLLGIKTSTSRVYLVRARTLLQEQILLEEKKCRKDGTL